MKNIWIFFLPFMVIADAKAQINLVPNPSFELLDSCPDAQDQIDRCIGWEKGAIYCTIDCDPSTIRIAALFPLVIQSAASTLCRGE